jgi:hypothetical protein
MGRANGWALLALGPVVVALAALFVLLHGWSPIVSVGYAPLLPLVGAFIAGVLVHEVLHAIAWKIAAGLPWSDMKLGFQWKTLTPFAHARVPMPARAYRIGAATPGVVLGVVPALIGLVTGNGSWMLFGLLFTLAAGGDALILWLLRGVAPQRRVEDHPTRAGCYVEQEA